MGNGKNNKYNKRNYKRGKRNKKSNKGLSSQEKSQTQKMINQSILKTSDPKKRSYSIGIFHNSPPMYDYEQPKQVDSAGFYGVAMTNQTTSIPIGAIPIGSNPQTRAGDAVMVSGTIYNFLVAWAPDSINNDIIIKFMLVSTLNDPSGSNLSFLPGSTNNASYHIPSLICPPGDTLGARHTWDEMNRVRLDLDLREYQFHWTKKYTLKQNDNISYKQLNLKFGGMYENPKKIEFGGIGQSNFLGRRYFLLYNSTVETTTHSLSSKNCPSLHGRINTYFRDVIQ